MSPRRNAPWPAGMPCWTDLGTPDVDAARAFYSRLLGWTIQDSAPEYGGYLMATVDGESAAGLGPAQPGAPAAWTLYFATEDAAASAARVTELGGTLVAGPMDVGTLGGFAIATDPSGAFFGLWQSREHTGVSIFNEPGALAWEDLRSTDPDAARAFYGPLLGWTFQELSAAGPDYTTVHLGDDPAPLGGAGGMMGMEGFPSHWVVYFGVDDADATVATCEELGGHVLAPAFDTEYGRMAALADPQGAAFWIAQLSGERPQPDRTA